MAESESKLESALKSHVLEKSTLEQQISQLQQSRDSDTQELDQLRSQIAFLNEQIERNTRDKAAERETQVSIAQANAQAQGVVVNTSSK